MGQEIGGEWKTLYETLLRCGRPQALAVGRRQVAWTAREAREGMEKEDAPS